MRTIVMLLIAALVLTPTLAHATAPGGEAALLFLAIPALVILLLIALEKKNPNWRDAATPSPLPSPTSESQSSTVPAGSR